MALLPVVGAAAAPAVLVATAGLTRGALPISVAGSTALLALLAAVAGLAAPLLARAPARIAVPTTGAVAALAAVSVGAGGGGPAALAGYCAAGGLAIAAATCGVGHAVERSLVGSGAAAAAIGLVVAVATTGHWRAAFVVVAVVHVVTAVPAIRPAPGPPTTMGDAAEARRRVLRTPTVRQLLTTQSVLGVVLVPVAFQATVLLANERASARSQATALVVLAAGVAVGGLAAARFAASAGSAAAVVRRARRGMWIVGAVLAVTGSLPRPLMFVGLAATGAAAGLVLALVARVIVAAVPREMTPLALGFGALWRWTFGGIGGLVLAAVFRNRFGDSIGLGILAAPALLGVRALHRAGKTADADASRVEIPDAEIPAAGTGNVETGNAETGGAPSRMAGKLLECSGIDFCYGPVQVLFDVSFAVDEGEMVALLGTNGAGKSTLLRVVSGLGLPVRGSVRFAGEDITFLDPDRRLLRGVTQIPGGKAVFGPLSVVDNMRAYGFTHGRNRAAVDRGIEASFEAFPRLHERRNQHAGTLSGGEQQMLALSKAFMLRPRLLLIDELSLGLAPKVVGELLEMVRRINEQGTAVVLVEQSVNVALSLVHHAYFMEKGAVQFDGAAADLLSRADLLRSVFLEGAAQGLAR